MDTKDSQKTTTSKALFFLDRFTHTVCCDLSRTIYKLFQLDLTENQIAQYFSAPPQEDWGHWALPCFFIAKQQQNITPVTAATQIAKAYQTSSTIFERVEAKGPYVNFFFQPSFLCQTLLTPIHSGALFQIPSKKHRPWLIEYSQPNTHKELHIGHLRNLCFGLALTTLLKKRGFSVVSCTYPGDTGAHTAKCLWYLKYHNKEKPPDEMSPPFVRKGTWLGYIYTKACLKFEESLKDEHSAPIVQEQITDILKQLQSKQSDIYKLWKETREWSCDLMKHVYKWVGVRFDKWYWESEVDEPSIQLIKELYQKKQLTKSESAIGKDLGSKLGFCLLLKSDGNGLYATKDIYLAKKKMEDYQPEKNIYIVDQRQERHFQQVFAVLEHIGCSEIARRSVHLKYNFVQLPSGPMSSRDGNIVPVLEIIQKMTTYVKKQFLQKYENDWNKDQQDQIARQIAEGAIKYGMNEQDLNKKIIFNMTEWLNWDGKSGPYIQYAYARSCSLLKKLNAFNQIIQYKPPAEFAPEEQSVIVHLSRFSFVMENSAWQMKTAPVCHYLFDLAKYFSRFYQNCPIGSLQDPEKKNFRLYLVQTVRLVLKEGLSYLSIPTPEKM